jgi:hypothetical protein
MSNIFSWLSFFQSEFWSWVSYTDQFPLSVRVIGAFLFILTVIFVVIFLVRGLLLRFKLWRLLWRLRKAAPTTTNFETLFSLDRTFSHLWREYSHTLQKQSAVDPQTGSQHLVAIRATTSADTFFNSHSIVDNRLRTEFFKHLPGICTGLGIIGTFLGLIQGLSAFQVSTDDAKQIQSSVQNLLHGVFEAFLVSAAAITIAMSITLIEKWLRAHRNVCIARFQKLNRAFAIGMHEIETNSVRPSLQLLAQRRKQERGAEVVGGNPKGSIGQGWIEWARV